MLDDKQQTIGFEHREREELALIRSLTTIHAADLTPRQLNGVRRLIETIYICSTSHLSHARERVLAEKAVGGPVTERTVRNWVHDAKALGVLTTTPRPGQASSAKHIEMDRIRELVRPPRRQEIASYRQETISCRQETISSLRVSPLRDPDSRPPPPPTPATTWQTAEAEVVKYLPRWQEPLRVAKGRVAPEYVLELVQFFASAGNCFGPGALYRRLQESHPGLPIVRGWPPPVAPSRECQEAVTILARCREMAADMPPMNEEEFRNRYLHQLEKRNLAGSFREALAREALARNAPDLLPIPG